MLVIRLQRTGRKGHAAYRLIVQDSRKSPTSGNVVAFVGSYNPHNKTVTVDKEKVEMYLKNGANPSPRVVGLLKSQGVKLPSWVAKPDKKKGSVRFPEKRRSTAPAGVVVEKPTEKPAKDEPKADEAEPSTEASASDEAPKAEVQAEEAAPTETEAAEPASEPEAAETKDEAEADSKE